MRGDEGHTLVPFLGILQRVDELRVEAGRHLDAHAAEEEPYVHVAQVRLLVPSDLVLGDEVGDDGVGRRADVRPDPLGDADHLVLFALQEAAGGRTTCL